ncbi:MAG: stage II sporulation protein M [Bacillota bacterium]
MQLLLGWRRNLEDLLYLNGGLVLLQATLFVIGVIFGALALRSIDGSTKLDLLRQLSDSVQVLRTAPEPSGGVLLREALVRHAKLLALFWVLAISLVGALGVVLLPLVWGFRSGFAVAFLAAEMGGRGILVAAAGHLPQSLLEVPAVILAATASVGFVVDLVRSWRARRRLAGFYEALAGYTGTLLSVGVLLLGAALVEGYVTPLLVRWVTLLLP